MRLLVVGHTYGTAFNQIKYAAMKRLNPSLELKIVSPPPVKDSYRRYEHTVAPGLSAQEAVCLKDYFYYSHMTYVFDPITFMKLIKDFKPDCIHIEEDPHSFIGFETVCLARLCCPKARLSFFVWDNLGRFAPFPLSLLKRCFTHLSLSRAACVVAGNHEAQRLLRSQKNYHGPSYILPQYGIDWTCYQGNPKPGIARVVGKEPGVPVIGFMGRLIPEKGVLLLCQALDGLKDLPWKWVIIGAGSLQKELEENWKPRFGDRLLMLGPGARADLPDYLKCLDMLVVPSVSTPRWKEQFGYIIAEAMAAGIPVIGSSSGAIPEVIGEAGVIFPEGDVDRLQKAIASLLQSAEDRDRFSRLGRTRSLEQYSHEAISAAYMKIFNQFSSN